MRCKPALLAPAALLAAGLPCTAAQGLARPVADRGDTILFFALFLALTMLICAAAARRLTGPEEYLTAGSSITPGQNGLATAGDYMSAGAFLGLSGAIYSSGLDGLFLAATYLASWPLVLFLVAEPLRRLGRYSFADVLSARFPVRSVRVLASTCSLTVIGFYLTAQMVGAGELVALLFGLGYRPAVFGAGAVMIAFSAFGGMRAATWVQITKAVLMLTGAALIAALAMGRFGFSFDAMLKAAVGAHPAAGAILGLRAYADRPLASASLAIGILFGTAGLPHVMMRFFTVANERAARISVFIATCLIAAFFALLVPIGFGAVALLRGDPGLVLPGGRLRAGDNMAPIVLSQAVGGHVLAGFISAVAFSTVLAVVAGLLIAGAATATNDLIVGARRGPLTQRVRLRVSQGVAAVLGAAATLAAIAFQGQNVAYLIAMATAVAASANFPVLILAIYWRGLTVIGAVAGGLAGLLSSILLTILGPTVWTKVLGLGSAPFPFDSPAIATVPLAFAVCWGASAIERAAGRQPVAAEAGAADPASF